MTWAEQTRSSLLLPATTWPERHPVKPYGASRYVRLKAIVVPALPLWLFGAPPSSSDGPWPLRLRRY
jgi:hypothetical protein